MRHLISFVSYNIDSFKGGNNELLVAVKQFDPEVTCQGVLESDKESCGEIIFEMPKSYSPCKFGPLGDWTVDYVLPYTIFSRKNN